MIHDQEENAMRKQLVDIARAVLENELDIVSAARALWRRLVFLPEHVDPMFIVIRSIDSQTDELPLRNEKALCPLVQIDEDDAEMVAWISRVTDDMKRTCVSIVERYGGL